MISPSADVRETTAGVPQASDSNAASPNVSCGPGASATSAEASSSATVCRSEMNPVKSTGSRAACRCSRARNGPSPTTTSRASTPASHNAATASMLRSARFSTDSRPQCTSRICVRSGPALTHRARAPRRVEHLQVHTQRDGDGVRRADAIEFFAGESGRAHHGVVVGRGAPVGEVGEPPGRATWKYLARKAIQALVRDHHRRRAVSAAPAAQRSQRKPVGDLQGVRSQAPSSNSRTGPGSTARYPPVNGISLAGTVIRTTPVDSRACSGCRPGTMRNTSWPKAQYSAPSRSTAVRRPPERGP